MIELDDQAAEEHLLKCGKNVTAIETDLLELRKRGPGPDHQRMRQIIRAVHSVRGAFFFDFEKISALAQRVEEVLNLLRHEEAAAPGDFVPVLLRATRKLGELVSNPSSSNQADISETVGDLDTLAAELPGVAPGTAGGLTAPDNARLRILLAEDDLASRVVLHNFLSRYGDCRIAANGAKAVDAARSALGRGQHYHLICMDIMMPEITGSEAIRKIRELEESHRIYPEDGAKIIMVTNVTGIKEVLGCFEEFCDAYLMKPVDLHNLLRKMKMYGLVQ